MYNIIEFGAEKNTLCTNKIQNAVDKAFNNGGGTVVVPAGLFIIGTVELKSNVTLHLENGAVLKGSDDINQFKEVGYVHNELGQVTSMLYAIDAENIRITGDGLIDINGNIHFDPSKPIIPDNMKDRITYEQIKQCTWSYEKRVTQPVFFLRSTNIKIEGVRITNAPTWTVTFSECKHIKIINVNIHNHPNVPNNDGVHFCSSSDIVVSGCDFICADDCIAISCITDWNKASENVVITNCVFRSFSKAIVIGYMQSIIRNVTISNVVIQKSNRGICIMSSSKDGMVENVTVSNCIIDTEVRAGNWWGNGEPIFIMGTYHHAYTQEISDRNWDVNVRNIVFSSIICNSENAIGIIGDDNNITNVTFRDITVNLKDSKNMLLKGKILDLSPSVQADTIPQDDNDYWLVVRNSSNIYFNNVIAQEYNRKLPSTLIHNCQNVRL